MCKSVNVNSVKGIDSKVMEDKVMVNVVNKLVNWEVSEGFVRGLERKDNRSYAITEVLPFEDKVRVLDKFFEGRMTDILDLIEKFRADYKSIKTVRGLAPLCVPMYNANSLKAWLRRNDTKDITSSTHVGLIKFCSIGYNLADFSVGNEDLGLTPKYAVDSAFNEFLEFLYECEKNHYLYHNPDVLYVESVCKNLENYGYGQRVIFSMGSSGDYLVYRYDSSEGYIIEKANDSDGAAYAEATPLSIEEVKQLEKALAPVEEKYQAMLRAKEEMESALEQAGIDFLDAVGIK